MSREGCRLSIGNWLGLAVLIMIELTTSHCAIKSGLLIATCQMREGMTESSGNCSVTVLVCLVVRNQPNTKILLILWNFSVDSGRIVYFCLFVF